MPRLTSLAPLVGSLAPAVATGRDAEGHSPTAEPWRKWYSSPEWRALKRRVHLRDKFTCQCGCGTFIGDPRERIADHKRPHRGNRTLFFAEANVQTLWKPHHDGWKQRLERRAGFGG